MLAIALAIVSWGAYGPVLHKGQAAMHHSRLRPLICVGLAYFVIAVIVPYFFLGELGEDSTYRSLGTLWSLLAGAFGAVGALGIIMAFNSGGQPVFVMPLVFGGAPVVNTLFASRARPVGQHQPVVSGRADPGDCRRGDGAGACAARRWQKPSEVPASEVRRRAAAGVASRRRRSPSTLRLRTRYLYVSALSRDILAAPGAAEADALHRRVGLQLGGGDARAQRRDAQHAAAVGDDLAVAQSPCRRERLSRRAALAASSSPRIGWPRSYLPG